MLYSCAEKNSVHDATEPLVSSFATSYNNLYTELGVGIFLKMGQPLPLFHLFSYRKLVVSRIRTRIIGVEGDDADH